MKIVDKSLFDDNDLKLIEILIANKDFSGLLLTLRSILRTPIEGFSFTRRGTNSILQARYEFFNDRTNLEMLVKSSFFLINAFDLPKKWHSSMAHLILNDEIIPPDSPIKFFSKDNLLVIEVSEGMSVSTLTKSLAILNKDKGLTKELNALPNPKKKISLHKLQNIQLNQEMIKLKSEGSSNKDIAEVIGETFDEQKVDKYMRRYKVLEKKLMNNNYPYGDLLSKKTEDAEQYFDIDRYFTVSEILNGDKT